MKVKICGIRTFEEALEVIEAGADMIGFNFYPPSPRYITPGNCMRLVLRLETALREEMADVLLVGVFVNATPRFIHSVFRDCHLEMIQLSGDEPPEVLEELGDRRLDCRVIHGAFLNLRRRAIKPPPRSIRGAG